MPLSIEWAARNRMGANPTAVPNHPVPVSSTHDEVSAPKRESLAGWLHCRWACCRETRESFLTVSLAALRFVRDMPTVTTNDSPLASRHRYAAWMERYPQGTNTPLIVNGPSAVTQTTSLPKMLAILSASAKLFFGLLPFARSPASSATLTGNETGVMVKSQPCFLMKFWSLLVFSRLASLAAIACCPFQHTATTNCLTPPTSATTDTACL